MKWVGQVRQEAPVRARSWNHLSWGWSLMLSPKAGSPLIKNWPPCSSLCEIPVLHRTCHLDLASCFYLLCLSALGQLRVDHARINITSERLWEGFSYWKKPSKQTKKIQPTKTFSAVLFNPNSQKSLMPGWRTRLCSVAQKVGRRGRAGIKPVPCSEQRPQHRAGTSRICSAKPRGRGWKLSPDCRQEGWT